MISKVSSAEQGHFGTSKGPLGSQNGTPKWPWSVQKELQNEIVQRTFKFEEKVPAQGGSGDAWGSLMGAQLAPRRPPWGPRTCPNEGVSSSKCIQNDSWKSDITCDDPKLMNRPWKHSFLFFSAAIFVNKRWKHEGVLKFRLSRCWSVLDLHFEAFWPHLETSGGV